MGCRLSVRGISTLKISDFSEQAYARQSQLAKMPFDNGGGIHCQALVSESYPQSPLPIGTHRQVG